MRSSSTTNSIANRIANGRVNCIAEWRANRTANRMANGIEPRTTCSKCSSQTTMRFALPFALHFAVLFALPFAMRKHTRVRIVKISKGQLTFDECAFDFFELQTAFTESHSLWLHYDVRILETSLRQTVLTSLTCSAVVRSSRIAC